MARKIILAFLSLIFLPITFFKVNAQNPPLIKLKGELNLIHFDDFKNKKQKSIYQIKTDQKQTYQVRFLKTPPSKTPSLIELEGKLTGQKIEVVSGKKPSLKIIKPFHQDTIGEIKTLVILFNFTNNQSQPFSPNEIYSSWFTLPTSVQAYFKEASFSQTNITGTVTSWLTIPSTNENCSINWPKWTDLADQKASLLGYNLSNYQRIAYIFPTTQTCSHGAWAYVNGDRIWINGVNSLYFYLHELGHTFGLEHANSLDCRGIQINNYSLCQINEYGDPFDIMGVFNTYHTNNANKVFLGWIPLSRVQEINQSGIYTLYPLETISFSPQTLRIYKKDTAEYYYLSYRHPIGFDYYLPTEMTSGISIHIKRASGKTFLLDATPEYPFTSFLNAALKDNLTFTDPVNKITITQLYHTPFSATAHINLNTCQLINGYVDPNPATAPSPLTFTFTSNLAYTEIDFHPGLGAVNCVFNPQSAKCINNPKDSHRCWWQWHCQTQNKTGNFTATFNNLQNCPKSVSYQVIPLPTPTPSPDTLSPNKPKVKVKYSPTDDPKTPWDEENALIFSWKWQGDRTCPNCQPQVGFCKPNNLSSGKTKVSCNPTKNGPFWWQIADETLHTPRVYYYHNGYKQNITLPNNSPYPPQGTKFVVSCKGKENHTFRIDVQTRDALGNFTGKVNNTWPDNVWAKATCP